MKDTYNMAAEAVSEGHPDKLADQISDAVLDEYLKVDPNARGACECLISGNTVVVAGEITAQSDPHLSIPEIATKVFQDTGYDNESLGFDLSELEIMERLQRQSEEIANGVNRDNGSLGAGDQGIMIGYACNETPELMPIAVSAAKRLILKLTECRQGRSIPWLWPDAKCQVTVKYSSGVPLEFDSVVLSTQHSPGISLSELRKTITDDIINPVLSEYDLINRPSLYINPAGFFTKGGPGSDTGLTGRKIAVDSYGPYCPVGGGAFSGKDATKVDRSGAYMARYVAKNIVNAGLADWCEIRISCAIGQSNPLTIDVKSNRGWENDAKLAVLIQNSFDLSLRGIIDHLELTKPVYLDTARVGHFGLGAEDQTWESAEDANRITDATILSKGSKLQKT